MIIWELSEIKKPRFYNRGFFAARLSQAGLTRSTYFYLLNVVNQLIIATKYMKKYIKNQNK